MSLKRINYRLFFWAVLLLVSCASKKEPGGASNGGKDLPEQFLVVLGITQDAGYPQLGCEKACCADYYAGKETKKHVTCLALVDRTAGKYWLIEATPDITAQLKSLQEVLPHAPDYEPDGIFLTHAHIGHYTGLMQFGREAMGAKAIPVWAMPRMDSFLRNNGPWSQLVKLENIRLNQMQADSTIRLDTSLSIRPFRVPHRDEYSETVGFQVFSKNKKVLFIPDIDKWEKWDRDIVTLAGESDISLLDGTFYKNGELAGRDMREVPHPFVEESLRKFSGLSLPQRSKIWFIHFNHTNPLLKDHSAEKDSLRAKGYKVPEEGMVIEL